MHVSANPQFKTLDLYDSKMQKRFQGVEKKEQKEPEKREEKKETQKQEVDEEGEAKIEKKSKKGKGVGV